MKKASVGLIAALAAFGLAGNVQAQMLGDLPLSVEVRGGVGFPTGDLGEEGEGGAETGVGFGANLQYQFTPMLSAYAGYSRFEFGVDTGALEEDEGVGDVDVDYIDSGFNGGVQANFSPMMALGGLSPWVRGGAVYHEFEVDFNDNEANDLFDDERSTDAALGFEVGAGVDYALGEVISVTPGVRYVSYSTDPTDGGSGELDINYFVADIGLRFRF